MSFSLYDNNYFNGITRHLKRAEIQDNVVYVSTTNSSHQVDYMNWGESDVILNDKTDYFNVFASQAIENSYVLIHFHKHKVKVKSYSISSRDGTTDKLTAWNLTGSNDNHNWHFIDKRVTDDLIPSLAYNNYEVANFESYYKTFRLMQTAPGTERNLWHLTISRIELFGNLILRYSHSYQTSFKLTNSMCFVINLYLLDS